MKKIFLVLVVAISLVSCNQNEKIYHAYTGPIFGTSFSIEYEYSKTKSLDSRILKLMQEFNASLSTYDPNSTISIINQSERTADVDDYFVRCFKKGQEISMLTDGAFDLTVAPLVNIWGFGFTKKDSVSPERIDSLLALTGYKKVRLESDKFVKEVSGIMLDASAIAKGFGVDVVAEFLESKGVENFLVEIGGELRCRGLSSRGIHWRVGVDKPIENLLQREIQAVLSLSDISMATSGNYRQFYVEKGIKYSHTIDPHSGYPVRHSLLSATVLTKDCMSADAYATAFMVMGLEKAKLAVNSNPDLEAFFIYSDDTDSTRTWASEKAMTWLQEY